MITTGKIGRNDNCVCGSGKKYKKCCYLTQEVSKTENDNSPVAQQIQELTTKLKNTNDKIKIVESDIKMSDIISDFAEEIYNSAKTTERKKIAIVTSILFWNLTVMLSTVDEPEEKQEIMDEAVDKMYQNDVMDEKTFLTMMKYYKARKQKMFPDLSTIITDYKINADSGGEIYFSVVFSPVNKIKMSY